MENFSYIENHKNVEEDIVNLYDNVGWSNYTKDTESLFNGINNSLYTISCYNKTSLIGFIRVVGDGSTCVLIQDLLVLQKYQGKGIGSKLIKKILNKYKTVRQIVLITDNDKKNHNFYIKNGMVSLNSVEIAGFIKLN